ncbi:MAG: hypothetical protein JNJ99_15475 [Crocinitomicaceae bacterium]|nr:hypothetical protein [Crocinitomicaceae bacterium]
MNNKKKHEEIEVTEELMIKTLKRSGYLFEVEVARAFKLMAFFVTNNDVVHDERTGKSRDIDITANITNIIGYAPHEDYISTRVVCELKNNKFPLMLMSPVDKIEMERFNYIDTHYCSFEETFTVMDSYHNYLEELLTTDGVKVFSQFCSFDIKNKSTNAEDFVANHPDGYYDGILKVCDFINADYNKMVSEGEDYVGKHFVTFVPALIIKNDLYEVEVIHDEIKLTKVKEAILRFNYFYLGEPKTSFIRVLNEEGLNNFALRIYNYNQKIAELNKY